MTTLAMSTASGLPKSMMNERTRQIVAVILLSATAGIGVWALLRFTAPRHHRLPHSSADRSILVPASESDLWDQALERAKADRGEPVGGSAKVETPTEL